MRKPTQEITVSQLSGRVLEIVAAFIAERPVRVALSNQVKSLAAVQLKTDTIMLHPLCGLYDLCLCGQVLADRPRVSRDEQPASPSVRSRAASAARRKLAARFGDVEQFDGVFHPTKPLSLSPALSWEAVQMKSRPLPEGLLRNHGMESVLELEAIGGVQLQFDGASTMEELLKQLLAGKLPLEKWTGLPEAEILTVPVRVQETAGFPVLWEKIEMIIAGIRKHVNEYAECYRRSSVTRTADPRPRFSADRGRLDGSRLARAMAEMKAGQRPKPFSRPCIEWQQVFRPEQHLIAIGIDIYSLGGEGNSRALPLALLQATQDLGVDSMIYAFEDFLLPLAADRWCYLHMPHIIKTARDPFEPTVWRKLERLMFRRREADDAEKTAAACCPQLQMRTLTRALTEHGIDDGYRNFGLFYTAGRDFKEPPVNRYGNQYQRIARSVDEQIKRCKDKLGGDWHFVLSLPEELKLAGAANGQVSSAIAG